MNQEATVMSPQEVECLCERDAKEIAQMEYARRSYSAPFSNAWRRLNSLRGNLRHYEHFIGEDRVREASKHHRCLASCPPGAIGVYGVEQLAS